MFVVSTVSRIVHWHVLVCLEYTGLDLNLLIIEGDVPLPARLIDTDAAVHVHVLAHAQRS